MVITAAVPPIRIKWVHENGMIANRGERTGAVLMDKSSQIETGMGYTR